MFFNKTLCFTIVVILLYADVVCCKWCTRKISEKHVFTITEVSKCPQSYQDACDWFSSKMCTYYELVTCYKEHNQTVVQYKTIEECCPEYELDPTTNVTCIRKPEVPVLWNTTPFNESKVQEVTLDSNFSPVVRLSVLENGDDQTRKSVHKTIVKSRNYTVQYYKSEKEHLFGLSDGAYAGIICLFLFVSSVLILILVHIIKRRQKNAAAKADIAMGTEMREKMIQAPPPQA